MKERPILFSGPMVRAILDGSKTQTRRALNPQPTPWGLDGGFELPGFCSSHEDSFRANAPIFCSKFGRPGDRLWVRETWGFTARVSTDLHDRFMKEQDRDFLIHRASSGDEQASPWKPSIHMPRWACRLVLEITSVRVERLQDISQTDAISEGILSVRTDDWDAQHFPEWKAASNAARLAGTKPPLGPSPKESFSKLWESINGSESWPANPWVWVIEFKRI